MNPQMGGWKIDGFLLIQYNSLAMSFSLGIETLRSIVLADGTFAFRQENGGKKLCMQIKNLNAKVEIMNPGP